MDQVGQILSISNVPHEAPSQEGIKYSIVIPTFTKDEDHYMVLLECLRSVFESIRGLDAEVILVNDGSPYPNTALDNMSYHATYIRHPKNMGIAPSWNDGIKLARGYYIAVINDDITVEKGWLEALENAVNWPNAMVSAPGVFGKDNFTGIEDNYQWYPGYCFMITQDTINTIGYFDEQFTPFNYEDTDYWTRCLMEGGLLMRNYSTTITHREGHVLHTLKYDEVSEINKQKFITKHGFDPIPVFYYGKKGPWDEFNIH